MAGTKKSLESDNVDLLQARRLMLSMAGMLIKNKPADMSVGDYIEHLRAHQISMDASVVDNHPCGTNQAAIWKAKHAEAEKVKVRTEKVIGDLSQENQRLQKQIDDLKAAGANAQKKRKRLLSPLETHDLSNNNGHGLANTRSLLHGDVESPSALGFLVEKCLGDVYIFQFTCTHGPPDVENLTAVLTTLCHDCIAVFTAIEGTTATGILSSELLGIDTDSGNTTPPGDEMRARLVKATFSKILFGLGMLAEAYVHGPYDRVVYQVAKLFSALIQLIREPGTASSAKPTKSTKANKGRKRAKLTEEPKVQSTGPSSLPTMLCDLLNGLLGLLSSDVHQHPKVWDGILFDVLSRTGEALGVLVFNEPTASTAAQYGTAIVEAPVLVWLLRTVLHFYQKRNGASTNGGPPGNPGGLGCVFDTTISGAAISNIQGTLLQAVFPNDHDSFSQTITYPVDPSAGTGVTMPTVNPDDLCNWFTGEVWRMVGWDILRNLVGQNP